jgi:hypothetical protein
VVPAGLKSDGYLTNSYLLSDLGSVIPLWVSVFSFGRWDKLYMHLPLGLLSRLRNSISEGRPETTLHMGKLRQGHRLNTPDMHQTRW